MLFSLRKFAFPYLARQRRWLGIILGLTLASAGVAALQPWPMKLLIDYALGDALLPVSVSTWLQSHLVEPTSTVIILAAGMATLLLWTLSSAIGVGLSFAWTICGQRMVNELAADMFSRLQRLSLAFHGRQSVGDSLSRLTEDTSVVASLANNLLMAPLQYAVTLAAMVWIGFLLDPLLALLVLAVAPLLALSSRYYGAKLKRRARLGRESKSRLMGFVHQTLRNVPLVQTFGTQSRHTGQFRELADDAIDLSQRGELLGSSYGLVNGFIAACGMALVLFVGGRRVISGAIPLGTLLVFLAYVRMMQESSNGLFKIFTKLKVAEASLERIGDVLQCDEFVPEPARPTALPRPVRGQLRFENVTFGYEPERPILHEIDLEIAAGETIALVGATGSGKSTLASLIPRFADPWQGRICLDGIDVRELALDQLRMQISMLLQDPFLLPRTIADNIALGRPGAPRDEVIAAACSAQADGFIRDLPEGYDTLLAEGGRTLSGGERQRVAIARAFFRDAPVLILDEPTSALDVQTEDRLTRCLRDLMRNRTTLVIAHRLSTIRQADRIVVLDHGRIVESGSHDQLLQERGYYWRFCSRQFETTQEPTLA
jgi:ATP-binding cassette, subfamily B, bacterial